MGRVKRSTRKGLCGHAIELLPELSGSGSGHGSRPAHWLHPPHNPLPKQHQRATGPTGRCRVGHGAAAPRRASGQCGRPLPHFVKRVVPECAPSGFSEPNPAAVFGCLSIWATAQCGDRPTWESSRPNSASTLSANDLEWVPWHKSKAFQQGTLIRKALCTLLTVCLM